MPSRGKLPEGIPGKIGTVFACVWLSKNADETRNGEWESPGRPIRRSSGAQAKIRREKDPYVSTFSREISRRSVCEPRMSTPTGLRWTQKLGRNDLSAPLQERKRESVRERPIRLDVSRENSRRSVCEPRMSIPTGLKMHKRPGRNGLSALGAGKSARVSKCPAFSCVWRFERDSLYNTYGNTRTRPLPPRS